MRQPWIKDQTTAIVLGILLFAAGVLVLYDAWERRGARTPIFLRWALPT